MQVKANYTIWARESHPSSDLPVLLWNSFELESLHRDSISLPTYIEEHADEIRSRLLSFLCGAKFASDGRTSIEDALITHEGLSAWWLSSPSLKQWGKRQSIPTACRLIAVEMIVGADNLSHVTIETADENLRGLFHRVVHDKTTTSSRIRRWFYRKIFHPLRALGSLLRYLRETRLIPQDRDENKPTTQRKLAFFDFYGGNRLALKDPSEYTSRFWGKMAELADSADWYHIYPRNVDRFGIRNALDDISNLNAADPEPHRLFLGRLGFRDVLTVTQNYLSQRRVHQRFRTSLLNFKLEGSDVALWHVFEDEWDDSVVGSTAIRHLILLKTTDFLVQKMPRYVKIFYLMENQPWEVALVFCVRRHKKGSPIGVAHSTVRFWDLRYFLNASEVAFVNPTSRRPCPDKVLVNGESSKRLLVESGFPEESASVVEALRYQYLRDLQLNSQSLGKYVLLLGDFLEDANSVLMSVVRESIALLGRTPSLKIRSHPICPITDSQLGDLSLSVSFEELSDLLKDAAVVITTAASSSAAESVALGKPTIVVRDARSLNFSPFRNSEKVYEVKSGAQLASLLRNPGALQRRPPEVIFCLDHNYPRWQRELSPA
jgi:surface carbohydrate biosynthesis protein (TIGR04326 family)